MQFSLARLAEPSFWSLALQVAGVNFLLSGDNVVAITLAARELPKRQRRWGMALGVGVAVILTAFFIAIVSFLMQTPFLRLAAGAALFYVASNLGLSDPDDGRVLDVTYGVFRAAQAIAVATLVMSFDNVVAIAAVAQGDLFAMASGLVLSIPLVVVGAAALGRLLDRFRSLASVGAGLLGWIAGETIGADPALVQFVEGKLGPGAPMRVEYAIAAAGAVAVMLVRWRRPSGLSKAATQAGP